MVIDEKLINLAREVKDFPKLEVYGPVPGEKTTVLRVDNDCLSEEGKELLGISKGTGEAEETIASSTDEVTQCFAEASQAFGIALNKLTEGITLWFRNVALPAFSDLSEKLRDLTGALDPILKEVREREELMSKGRTYGISPRIMALCGHQKKRVRKKNLNRLRKEVERYERSRRNTRGHEAGESTEGHAGDCQPDESVPGEAGGTESNG